MASKRYLWRVYCPSSLQNETIISDIEPTVCPSDGVTPVDPDKTVIMESLFQDMISEGYINIESRLADNQALKISASDTNGGIDINAGFGGISIDTTNSVSINAATASNFTASMGNLTLDATLGLVNIDGGSGINLGNNSTTPIINIGSASNNKDINVGNNTGTSSLNLRSGSGNITLNTTGDISSLIQMYSSGGVDIDCVGDVNIASGNNTGSAITLDASYGNGGITMSSGAQGIIISSNGGLIGIGTFSGGDIEIGTASVSRTITMGNTFETTSVSINSGTGGIAIGNNENSGEIHIGNFPTSKTLIIGNSAESSKIYQRFGAGGLIRHQEPHIALPDSNNSVTASQLLSRILFIDPTANRTLLLPSAYELMVGTYPVEIGDSIDFSIINNSSSATGAIINIMVGTGGSIIGQQNIYPYSDNASSYFSSGSGLFRLRFTGISIEQESYVVYRIS